MRFQQPLTTPVFGPGVVYDCPNHVLMEQKKFVKFGLSTDNFRAYVGMIEEEITTFINNDPAFSVFQDKQSTEWGTFQAFKTCSEMTILTASRTLQGPEIRSALDKSFADIYHDLDNGFSAISLFMPNLPLPSYRRRDAAQKAMSDFYVNIIQKRKAENRMVSLVIPSVTRSS
jgi:sterol 14-demethylase